MSDVHITKLREETPQSRQISCCIDIGASGSVVEQLELNRILTSSGPHQRRIVPPQHHFRFTDIVYESLDQVSMPLATPPGAPRAWFHADIASANILALLSMNMLDKKAFKPCALTNRLAKRVKCTTQDREEAFVDE